MIKTGNKLFDIFWQEYPPRINGAGAMEKKRKKPALKWFQKHNPSEEKVYDMLEWIRKDNELRAMSEKAGKFYSPPPDAIAFLNQGKWEDEIGVVTTRTQHREAHRSKAVYSNNVKEYIEQMQGPVKEWTDDQLRASPTFQEGWKYPEFRKWVREQRADRKDTTQDLPPPNKFITLYRGVEAYKKDNPAKFKNLVDL